MGKKEMSFEDVRKIALALPEVEESISYGAPALKLRGKLLTCPAINKSAEPGTLVVRIGFEERDALIAGEPEVYYLTDHYLNYACVLVRLSRVKRDALRALLMAGWEFVNGEGKVKKLKEGGKGSRGRKREG